MINPFPGMSVLIHAGFIVIVSLRNFVYRRIIKTILPKDSQTMEFVSNRTKNMSSIARKNNGILRVFELLATLIIMGVFFFVAISAYFIIYFAMVSDNSNIKVINRLINEYIR